MNEMENIIIVVWIKWRISIACKFILQIDQSKTDVEHILCTGASDSYAYIFTEACRMNVSAHISFVYSSIRTRCIAGLFRWFRWLVVRFAK